MFDPQPGRLVQAPGYVPGAVFLALVHPRLDDLMLAI